MSETRSPTPRQWRLWLTAVFVVALAIRAVVILQLRHSVVFDVLVGDGREYDAWAQRIVGGDWMGSGVFYQTPLYPYALAVVYWLVGHHVLAVRLIQAVLGATSCVLIGIATAQFFTRRAGVIASALLAVYGPAVFFDTLIQKSSVDGLLGAACLALLGAFSRSRRLTTLAGAAIAAALFTLNRENAAILLLLVVAWLLVFLSFSPAAPWRQRVGWAATFAAVFLLTLLPIGVRNWRAGGEFVLTTAQAGPNFYIGNHAGAPGVYQPLVVARGDAEFERTDAERLAVQAAGAPLTPGEVSTFWLRRGLAFVASEPAAWMTLLAKKTALTFASVEVADAESIEAYADWSSALRVLAWINFGALLPLAAFGMWVTRHRWRELFVLYLYLGGMAATVALFYVMARYRFPLVPVLAMFGGAGLAALARELRGRDLVAALACAALAAVGSNAFFHERPDPTYANVGAELLRSGQTEKAIPLLERAITTAPDHEPAYFALGVALDQIGHKDRALEQFKIAVDIAPDDFNAQSALALALADAGRHEDALRHFAAAVGARDDSAEAHYNYGRALAAVENWSDAAGELARAIALKPDYEKAEAGLGVALLESGAKASALDHLERALRIAQSEGEEDEARQIEAMVSHVK